MLLGLALGLLAQGCSMTFDATHLGVPATLSSDAGTPPEGEHFSVTGHGVYALWGVVKLGQPSLRRALATQLGDGQSVADVKIKVRSKFFDLLITGLTLGVIVPRSVTYEGVIVGGTR